MRINIVFGSKTRLTTKGKKFATSKDRRECLADPDKSHPDFVAGYGKILLIPERTQKTIFI